ncbi:MAG: ParA family protein, partial [Opitutaceae bacterium]
PSIGLLMMNSLAAADRVLLPVQCEYYALEGVTEILGLIEQIRQSCGGELAIEGVVMTMFDGRTRLSQEVVGEVRHLLGAKVFETLIPRTTRLAEAPSHGKPILYYDKYSTGSAAYEVLAQEFLARLES